jgi:hypothetical protein
MPEARASFHNGCHSTTPRSVPVSRRSRFTTHATCCVTYGVTPDTSARLRANGAPLKACVRNSRGFSI